MINKFKKIKNVGSFFLFNWDDINPSFVYHENGQQIINGSGPVTIDSNFKKYNILFGENGAGKTTIVKILKSINYDSKDYIKKHWDHESDTNCFIVETDNGTINYDDVNGLQNNSLIEKILFFDKNFIENFVHSSHVGRDVNHNKNTGNLLLYLGNFFQYRTQLNSLSQLINNLTEINSDTENKNNANFYSLNSMYSYEEIKEKIESITEEDSKKIDDIIEETESNKFNLLKELEKVKNNLLQSEEIKKIIAPAIINTLIFPTKGEVEKYFDFSIGSSVSETIGKITNKEEFLREGLEIIRLHNLDKCPFCAQEIKKEGSYISPIKDYEEIFNESFINSQKEIIDKLSEYRLKLLNLLSIKTPDGNTNIVAKINRIIGTDYVLPEINLDEKQKDLIKKEIENIDTKLKNIVIKSPTNILLIEQLFRDINEKIEKYNINIKDIELKLIEIKLDINSGNLEKIRLDIEKEIEKNKFKSFIFKNYKVFVRIFYLSKKINENKKIIKNLEIIFESVRRKVEEEFKIFVDTYFAEIEKNINYFCPDLKFKIIGSHPKYDLRVGDVTCGLEVQYKNKDRLSELSEGERQAIALSYFLAYLNKEQDKDKKIVVFDDPINSFDAGKRKQASEQIYKESANYNQLFILTCDSLFRSYCMKFCNRTMSIDRNFYYILKSASSSIHFRPKELSTIYSTFRNDFRNISTVLGTDDMIVVYGQKLRYCLEEIKDRHLGYSEDKFDNILEAVKNGKINNLVSKIDEIREIYSYCNTGGLAHFPKDGQTSWNEIKNQIDRYIKLGL